MRHIDVGKLKIDDAWSKKATDALDETRKKPLGKGRADYINSRSDIWT